MARLRRSSIGTLDKARQILAGLKEITPKPDFGPSLSEALYEAEIGGYNQDLEAFNTALADVDDKSNRLDDRKQRLHQLNQRIQAAVRAVYGPDSSEFEVVGGVRSSERRKSVRKTKAPATT